jgi:hypothetical protein
MHGFFGLPPPASHWDMVFQSNAARTACFPNNHPTNPRAGVDRSFGIRRATLPDGRITDTPRPDVS